MTGFIFKDTKFIMKTTVIALMEMESLAGINLFFPGLAERPAEAPARTMEKKVYDGELVMDSRIKLLIIYHIKNDLINY